MTELQRDLVKDVVFPEAHWPPLFPDRKHLGPVVGEPPPELKKKIAHWLRGSSPGV